ncbi:MAG: hypothetical protein ABIC40_01990 [bacterium]
MRIELKAFGGGLEKKPEIVCWTKADILPAESLEAFAKNCMAEFISRTSSPEPIIVVSAVRGDGISPLLHRLSTELKIDLVGVKSDEIPPEYADGEAPEGLSLKDLSMDRLNENDSSA